MLNLINSYRGESHKVVPVWSQILSFSKCRIYALDTNLLLGRTARKNSCEFVKFVSGFGVSQAILVGLCPNGNQNPTYRGFNTKEVIRLYETLAKVRAV